MYFHHIFNKKSLLSFLELAFVLNLILLDLAILGRIPSPPLSAVIQNTNQQKITSPLGLTPSTNPVPTTSITVIPTPEVKYISTPTFNGVKDYYVPLGSGQSSASDWQNVTGIQAYVDSSNYPGIKSVVFEVSAHIPTGNESADIRLFNATDQHPVWFSDVSLAGGDPKFLISQPINLDKGNKLYQVQMKTQLQYPAILDQARIHITLD